MALPDIIQKESEEVEAEFISIINENQVLTYRLTPREMQVLELYAKGSYNKEIAERLVISGHTVKHYSSNILQKLKARNRVHAVHKATIEGILPEEAEKQELTLTPAQARSVFYRAHGYSDKETAEKLELHEGTIRDFSYYARKRNDYITTGRLVYLATMQYFKNCPVALTEKGEITLKYNSPIRQP